MNIDAIQDSFKATLTDAIRLIPEGVNRYRIATPFHFDDGEHFVLALRADENGNWIITDEGHTWMHLSYHVDVASLDRGTRNDIIEGALEKYGVMEQDGQLFAQIDEFANAGNVFYNVIQCLINVTNVSYLSRERVASTFIDDFRKFIKGTVDSTRFEFDYSDKAYDPNGKYPVDCRINGMACPLHMYAIGNDDKCRDTTIGILQFQKWNLPFLTLGIFEDQEQISRKVLSRFTDVCDRQFSSLVQNQERIKDFLTERMG